MPTYARTTQPRPAESRPAESRPAEPKSPEPKSPEERAAEALAARGEHAEPRGLEWAESGGGPLRRRTDGMAPPTPGPEAGADPADRESSRGADGTVIPFPQLVRDAVLLLARVVLGVILVAHGLQKVLQGVSATAEGFETMGIPLPDAAAVVTMAVELGGGALLILGLLTPIAGLASAVILAGAIAVAHVGNGLFVADGGWELAAGVGVGVLMLTVLGPGRFSLDQFMARRLQSNGRH